MEICVRTGCTKRPRMSVRAGLVGTFCCTGMWGPVEPNKLLPRELASFRCGASAPLCAGRKSWSGAYFRVVPTADVHVDTLEKAV
eukprot:scaffold57456_cov30-Tisochrysis_lutea.AAC.2